MKNMKSQNILIIILLALVLNLPGCVVVSTNDYCTCDLRIDVKGINGDWKGDPVTVLPGTESDDKNKSSKTWTFEPLGTSLGLNHPGPDLIRYLYTYDDKDRRYCWEVEFFKINDTLLADFIAADYGDDLGLWGLTVLPMHILMRVVIEKDILILTPLNVDWFFDKKNSEKVKSLSYVKYGDKNRLYTSTPEEWIEFLKKNLSDEHLFADKYKLVFKKVESK